MKKYSFVVSCIVFALSITGCTTNTLTHRSELSLVSDQEVITTSTSQYKQFLSTNKVISPNSSSKDAAVVTKVSKRIIAAVQKYYADLGRTDELSDYSWEINTVVSNEANAWLCIQASFLLPKMRQPWR